MHIATSGKLFRVMYLSASPKGHGRVAGSLSGNLISHSAGRFDEREGAQDRLLPQQILLAPSCIGQAGQHEASCPV